MNQILVSKKLYVTPELKRKKRMYKVKFFVSIFAICSLFSYYLFSEYDRNKSEEVSKQILSAMSNPADNVQDDTVRSLSNDVLIVALDNSELANNASTELLPENTKNDGTREY